MRQTVAAALRGMDPISVENPVHPGTPDINFAGGWIELKCEGAWPKRPTTILRIDHFTPQQRVWLTRRWRCDQRAWLLLRVGAWEDRTSEWLLFAGDVAAAHVGRTTREKLGELALALWTPQLNVLGLRTFVQPQGFGALARDIEDK